MTLEEQVTSLEWSQKLASLGVKRDSLFWWVNGHGKMELHDKKTDEESIPAYTVAELGEILPSRINIENNPNMPVYLTCWKGEGHLFSVVCETLDHRTILHEFDAKEANVRAKMLAYLLEHNLITV